MAAAHFLFFYILHLPILFPAAEGKLSTEPNLSAGKKRAKEDGKKENQIYRTKSLSNQIASINNGGYQTLINRPIKRKTRELFKVLCYTKMQTKEVAARPPAATALREVLVSVLPISRLRLLQFSRPQHPSPRRWTHHRSRTGAVGPILADAHVCVTRLRTYAGWGWEGSRDPW